jgi:hypothetical protein
VAAAAAAPATGWIACGWACGIAALAGVDDDAGADADADAPPEEDGARVPHPALSTQRSAAMTNLP